MPLQVSVVFILAGLAVAMLRACGAGSPPPASSGVGLGPGIPRSSGLLIDVPRTVGILLGTGLAMPPPIFPSKRGCL